MLLRVLAIYGFIAGAIVAASMVVTLLLITPEEIPEYGMLYGYTTMIVALTAVFLGVKHYRDHALGGVIRFGRALLVGLGISAVASVVYAIGWEIALTLSDFDFTNSYAESIVESARTSGASPEQMQEAIANAESFRRMYASPLYRLPLTFIELFPVGVLISLISAALLRNSRFLPARPQG